MAVTPITLPGQLNGSGNDDVLFWRLFAGEVLTAFHRENKFMPLHRVRTIANGKSATFPITGTAGVAYHTLGSSVFRTDDGESGSSPYLSKILGKEKEIFVDDPIVSGTFVGSIDEMKNHWDHRSIYTNEIATALAEQADKNILSTLLAAARKDPAAADGSFSSMPVAPGDMSKVNWDGGAAWVATSGTNIARFIFKAAQIFDTYNVPKANRFVAMRPKQYYLLAQEKDLVDRDISQNNGDYAQAKVLSVAGIKVIMTNAFGSTDETNAGAITTQSGVRNDPHGSAGAGYLCNWTTVGAIAFTPEAAATVKMKEISVASEYQLERLGNLILAHYVMGHNTLRPECAIEMRCSAI